MQWTEGEIKFLMAKAASVSVDNLAEALGKSEITVRMMALKMDIKLLPEPPKRTKRYARAGLAELGSFFYSARQQ